MSGWRQARSLTAGAACGCAMCVAAAHVWLQLQLAGNQPPHCSASSCPPPPAQLDVTLYRRGASGVSATFLASIIGLQSVNLALHKPHIQCKTRNIPTDSSLAPATATYRAAIAALT